MGDDNDGHKSQAGCLTTHDLSEQQGLRGKTYIQTNSFNSHQISRWKGHPYAISISTTICWVVLTLYEELLKTKQNKTQNFISYWNSLSDPSAMARRAHIALCEPHSFLGCKKQLAHPHPRLHALPQLHPPSDSFPSHLYCQGLKPAGISISGGSYCAVIKQQLIANRVLLCLGLMRGEKINLVTTN